MGTAAVTAKSSELEVAPGFVTETCMVPQAATRLPGTATTSCVGLINVVVAPAKPATVEAARKPEPFMVTETPGLPAVMDAGLRNVITGAWAPICM